MAATLLGPLDVEAAGPVELPPQAITVLGTGYVDAARQSQPAGQLASRRRLVGATQRTGAQNVRVVERWVCQADEGRHPRMVRSSEPGGHRSHRRVSGDRR